MATTETISGQRILKVLFGSQARAAILTWFSLHPGQEVFLRDLAEQCGLSVTPVHRQLQKLEDIGLVESCILGKARAYKLQSTFPGLHPLGEVIKVNAGVAPMLQEALASQPIEVAFIFGSVATGKEQPESDLDLFVVGDVSGLDLVDALWKIGERIGREINPIYFTPEDYRMRMQSPSSFLDKVMDSPKLFLKGDDDALRRLAE